MSGRDRSTAAAGFAAVALLVIVALPVFVTRPASAQTASEVKAAVAANFTEPAREIAVAFEKASGHKVLLSFGATGQFYAQIAQGAPFEVLLAADKATPARAVTEGLAVAATQFTYATGKLVLYSKAEGFVTGEDTLRKGAFQKIAIANPATAPYGAAALETLNALQLRDALRPKIVQGQSIAQTFNFIDTANAELGFVAQSQVVALKGGSRWIVPDKYHAPILQDAVLLKPGERNAAARAFLEFLKSALARAIIEKYGYGVSE